MTLNGAARSCLGALLLLLPGQATAQTGAELTAVLTRIEGQVTLSLKSRAELRSVRPAARRQVIRRGETVHLPAGARAELVCSTENLVSLQGPREWMLDPAGCGRGLPLPESSYRSLAPQAGRLLPRKGILLVEFETRNADEDDGPVLLSPRNTAVMEARPSLVWKHVPAAVEYELQLRGSVELSIRVAAGEAHCGRGSGLWQDLEVCSWAPSDKWPALEPEEQVFLKIGSRQRPGGALRQVRESSTIHRLTSSDQITLQERLRQIDQLHLDDISHLLLTAGAYSRSGLHADAITTFGKALQAQEVPEVRVTLGDLYLTSGLAARADGEYRHALKSAPDPLVQAAAEIGLGQVAYARKLFSDARARFERAREIYAELGLPEEAEDARAAAERAGTQSGDDSP